MRDVLEEMSLHGVRPERQTYLIGLFSAMRGRKLSEAWHFWDEMRRHGHQPDVSPLSRPRIARTRQQHCRLLPPRPGTRSTLAAAAAARHPQYPGCCRRHRAGPPHPPTS
jgi:pentatricopeptide repeat protein